jgi:lipopolysaccharide export system permease protein
MPIIERYILRRARRALLLTLGALVATLWMARALDQLDIVTAKGQAIWTFFIVTLLALPAVVQFIVPIAFLAAVIVTLNTLNSDSEMPVIASAGASRKAVNRPLIMLAVLLAVVLALSHHILAPASLASLRSLLTRVRTDVIATLVQAGGFRQVEDDLVVHIREKSADGSFRDIFVNDERDPTEARQYTAARGVILSQAGGSYLVLQEGDLVRENHDRGETSVIAYETYALDLSQLGTPAASAAYKARERSTLYLLNPPPDDEVVKEQAERVAAEIHDRMTAPLYALVFGLVPLAVLGRPRTNRQDRSAAVVAVIVVCVTLRVGGFAALFAGRSNPAALPLLYAIPLAGIAFGAYGAARDLHLNFAWMERLWDAALAAVGQISRRLTGPARLAESERR